MRIEPDQTRLTAWRAFLVAHAAIVSAIERELAAERLVPLTWYDVLVALWEAPTTAYACMSSPGKSSSAGVA